MIHLRKMYFFINTYSQFNLIKIAEISLLNNILFRNICGALLWIQTRLVEQFKSKEEGSRVFSMLITIIIQKQHAGSFTCFCPCKMQMLFTFPRKVLKKRTYPYMGLKRETLILVDTYLLRVTERQNISSLTQVRDSSTTRIKGSIRKLDQLGLFNEKIYIFKLVFISI